MQAICRLCERVVTPALEGGLWNFRCHCGNRWRKTPKFHGNKRVDDSASRMGAALGALAGIAHGDLTGGAAGAAAGMAIGKLFDSDNGITCPQCRTARADPTRRSGHQGRQYHCEGCKRFSWVR